MYHHDTKIHLHDVAFFSLYRDCGVMDEDGDLEIVGRITTAERIKICGDVVYLPPIENALREHPKIKESCVSCNACTILMICSSQKFRISLYCCIALLYSTGVTGSFQVVGVPDISTGHQMVYSVV